MTFYVLDWTDSDPEAPDGGEPFLQHRAATADDITDEVVDLVGSELGIRGCMIVPVGEKADDPREALRHALTAALGDQG